MGAGFVILFWLIIAGVLCAAWIGALLLFLLSRKKKWRILKWLSGTAVVGGVIIALLVVSVITYGIIRSSVPQYVFTDVFHSSPTNKIDDIQSKVFWFADTGSIYLRFRTDISTFNGLIPKHLQKTTKTEFENNGVIESGDTPSWWLSTIPDSGEIYFRVAEFNKGKNFANETEWMIYDPQEQTVYYRFLGID